MGRIDNTGVATEVIQEIIALAKKHGIERVILFGSRARGDYQKTSDIDLAVKGGNVDEFAIDTEDTTSTLLTFDVVDLDRDIQQELQDDIDKDGIVIYEKT